MKKNNSKTKALYGKIFSYLVLVTIVSLTVCRLTKIELPTISDRELVFWLVEINY